MEREGRAMRFFKRDSGGSTPSDFWSWWAEGRDRVAQAIATGGFDQRLIGEISSAVRAIHPSMAWELSPGRTAQHAFCVSPEGNAELRQAALRWLASAPPADATWEYHASKQAAARLMGLEVAGSRFDLEEMRAIAAWDPVRRRVDVRLWHPQFDRAPEPVKMQVGFVFLDSLLGEEDVERWIGNIELLDAPAGGRTPAELKAEVERQKSEPLSDDTWVVGERQTSDGLSIVSANAALKRIDHPFHDHHVTIAIVMGIDRMPNDAEAAALNTEEDDLLVRLGDAATFAGRTTTTAARTLHFVAEDPDRMRPAIDGWAAVIPDSLAPGQPQRRLKVNFERDMDWTFQRELGVR
jgi:hypothetical protein